MLNIIHGADFHLDSPFSGLSPERAAQRRGEQRDLLTRLAQLAREKQADLVLLSGDGPGPLPGIGRHPLPGVPGPGQPRLL